MPTRALRGKCLRGRGYGSNVTLRIFFPYLETLGSLIPQGTSRHWRLVVQGLPPIPGHSAIHRAQLGTRLTMVTFSAVSEVSIVAKDFRSNLSQWTVLFFIEKFCKIEFEP